MNQINKNVAQIRKWINENNLDAFIIPHDDEYLSEYSPPENERLSWASGFTGSAGSVISRKDDATIFVDGRYTIQSKIESGKDFKILDHFKIINTSVFKNLNLGIDPSLFTSKQIQNFFLKNNKISHKF